MAQKRETVNIRQIDNLTEEVTNTQQRVEITELDIDSIRDQLIDIESGEGVYVNGSPLDGIIQELYNRIEALENREVAPFKPVQDGGITKSVTINLGNLN